MWQLKSEGKTLDKRVRKICDRPKHSFPKDLGDCSAGLCPGHAWMASSRAMERSAEASTCASSRCKNAKDKNLLDKSFAFK